MFGILYSRRNFIKVKAHQPHLEDFMLYLEMLVSKSPTWASNTGLDDMKWKDIILVLKAMWRRHKSVKNLKDISAGYARTNI